MMLYKLYVLFVASLCCLAPAVAETVGGRVVGVADGDTITILDSSLVQHRVRLSGIDAPEKAQAFGQKSKQSLSDLVFASRVTVETNKKDRYGRLIGMVFKDGLNANLEQINRGLAWHYKAFGREQAPEDRASFEAAES